MKLVLAAIALWFLASAFMISVLGGFLWLARKLPLMRNLDSNNWARLTAFGLLAPPSSATALAVLGLFSAFLCPYISARTSHFCLHSAKHFCAHSVGIAIWEKQFLLWGTGIWLAITGAVTAFLWKRGEAMKFSQPSAKLKRAIALAKLPANLPVWETECEESAGLVGFASPSIFVSKRLVRKLSVPALAVVLQHEYAHFLRRDHLVRPFLFAFVLLFALIPFAVWLQREWRWACEEAADRLATKDGKSAQLLSIALLTVQEVSGLKCDGHLQRRIGSLMKRLPVSLWAKWESTAAILVGLAFSVFAFSVPSVWLTFHCLAEALVQ